MRTPAIWNGRHGPFFALALVFAFVGRVEAIPVGRSDGTPWAIRSVRHGSAAAPAARSDVVPQTRPSVIASLRAGGAGAFVINVTFDGSITNRPNAAEIEAAFTDAVAVYEALLDDPIVVSILFRYATTYADGTPLPAGNIAVSETGVYVIPWASFLTALLADAATTNDATANGTLPAGMLTTNIDPSSANGRAVGLNTPSVKFADGSLGPGGPFDGIVTLNANVPLSFTRPPASGTYDARRSIEHEIDEVLGLGSGIDRLPDLRPQDLFSWAAPGVRGLVSSGSRYFSIDGGATSLVGFNQNPNGDLGDWLSDPCPQVHPYVQNAFSCPDQVSDVTPTSAEAVNLDVIGYDLATSTASTTTTTTRQCVFPQVECCPVGQPGCGLCGTDCGNGGCCPDPTPVCDNVNNLCFPATTTTTLQCVFPQVECCPVGQPGCGLCGTDCGTGGCCPTIAPVCDNVHGLCLVSAPNCSDGQGFCSDVALGFADVTCCSTPARKRQCGAACRPIVAVCKANCAGVPNAKKCKKRCRRVIVGQCKQSSPPACF
jgi:hypothetical protein